jgi:quercetin dioxygenase-like cupin family protein
MRPRAALSRKGERTVKVYVAVALVLPAALGALVTGVRAQDATSMTLIASGAEIKWQPAPASLPKGTQMIVLNGDPAKPGPFVLRIRFPPNTIVAPHTHATAENLTVLSGTLYHGMGEHLDKGQGKKLLSGGFVYLPAQMPHSVWTGNVQSVVQVTGTGPFGLKYVNPADDPSRAP